MSPKIFLGWLVAAAVTLVAAVGVTLSEQEVATVRLDNEPAFPLLRANPDAVSKISIETRDASFTLVRNDEGRWTAPEKSGYPAASGKVRELVVGLSDMQLVETKTKLAERYARLEVEDVAGEFSTSRLLRLEDSEGEVLAAALLGKRKEGFTGGLDAGTYLRRPGEDQSWLASGGVTLETEQVEWLNKRVIDLADDEIRRIDMAPGNTERYVVLRDSMEEDFRLEPLPEGRGLQSGALARLALGLSRVNLTDVKPRAELILPDSRTVATFVTFDGIAVTVELAKINEDHWAVLQARAATAQDGSPAQTETAGQAAEAINARLEGWAFQIDTFAAERLMKPLEDLLEKKDETS